MENELVEIDGKKAFTNTLLIAEGCNVEHRAVMQLLKNHQKDTEILSTFEMRKFGTKGRKGTVALLSEMQATFLVTLMSNGPAVLMFKQRLVKSFFKARKIISNLIQQRKDSDWQQVRKDGKKVYFQKTDIIKQFVEYATEQGSTEAQRYYANLAKMENSSLFFLEQKYKNLREVLTIKQLMQVSTADDVIDKALKEGMERNLDYHDCYKLAKDRIIAFVEIIGRSPVLDLRLLE